MKKAELIAVILGEVFPLFVGNVYKLLEREIERSENASELAKSLSHVLTQKFGDLTAERVLGMAVRDDEYEQKAPDLEKSQLSKIETYVSRAVDLYVELQSLTRIQIQQEYTVIIHAFIARRKEKLRDLGKKHDQAAFFNDFESQVDWEYWNFKVTWTPDEVVALSFEKDPRTVNKNTLLNFKPLAGSPFRDEYLNRLDDLNRSIDAKIVKSPLQKAAVSTWAQANDISLPKEMASRHVNTQNDKINGNTLHRFYLIILGLAINHYEYDVLSRDNIAQSGVADKISDSLKAVGADVSSKSLVRYLSKARAWVHSETLHPLIADARKRADADGRRAAFAKRQKP